MNQPDVFPRILARCEAQCPAVSWEIEERTVANRRVYKLTGVVGDLRAPEPINAEQKDDAILADAERCAAMIERRIRRLSKA